MINEIRFPNLGIELKGVGDGITIAGFEIKFYGMIIALGFVLGIMLASKLAKRSGIDSELIFDYVIAMMIPAIVGARLYYVIFSWDYYKNHLGEIINTRHGGLAIYGGVIAAVVVLLIFIKIRKIDLFRIGDVLIPGLLVGQILGRWGNFFNREAFGGFTDNLFAMQIPTDYFLKNGRLSEIIESGLYDKAVFVEHGGELLTYIQVHPTFLYESLWNLTLLVIALIVFYKFKKFDGQIVAIYAIGYGIGRFWIEGLRTDQLLIGSTNIPVSQVVAIVLVILGVSLTLFQLRRSKK